MARISKKEFFKYMSALYDTQYNDTDAYNILMDIIKRADDKSFLKSVKELANMTTKEKQLHRYALAVQGKEFTPLEIDQYISVVKYALKYIQE